MNTIRRQSRQWLALVSHHFFLPVTVHNSISSGGMEKISSWKVRPLDFGTSKYVKPVLLDFVVDGKARSWECMKVHDSVAIILYNEDRKKLIFVKQLRPAVVLAAAKGFDLETGEVQLDEKQSGYTLELCAGIIDKEGKSREEIAKEEVLEETGYDISISSLRFISSCRSGVGVTGSLQTLFFASVRDSQKTSSGGGIDDERIEIIELDIKTASDLLYCEDNEAPFPRPASLLFGLSWFFHKYLPENNLLESN